MTCQVQEDPPASDLRGGRGVATTFVSGYPRASGYPRETAGTEPAWAHTLTVEIGSQDHTQALLRFASDLHRRGITIDSLSSEQLSPATVGITTRFTATRRAADTVRRTAAARVEVLRADLSRPAVTVSGPIP
ncbi:hypothetical protein [Mycolicibacterium komossense]|nr:hypothetical protein [Mycolicibacterium komossense]